jgi:D-3-phosphoglycerate dehydrogenase
LSRRIPERINYINSEALAIELGIKIEHSYTNDSGSYTNLIRTRVSGSADPTRIAGSIFGQDKPRLVNILGFDIDVRPYGYMLFAKNKDVPGVIGRVGTILGKHKVNIGGFILSRAEQGQAFSVVRIDSMISKKILSELTKIPEIISLQQLACET